MIEYIVWSIRLWLVDYRERVRVRLLRVENFWSRQPDGEFWPTRWLRDFVDRMSPWDPTEGYRRTWIRHVLWYLSHPRFVQKRHSLGAVLSLLDRVTPYLGPGRYEAYSDSVALKAEWFDTHSEYASSETGSTDWGTHAMLFELTPPWSRKTETWLLQTDAYGFVSISQDNAKQRFAEIEKAWAAEDATPTCDICGEEWEDGGEGEDWNGETGNHFSCEREASNREGQPEYNGAFGA